MFNLAIITMILAHQPHIARDSVTVVTKPEVSKAYYAELAGGPATYQISTTDSFEFYVNLLAPDVPGAETDFVADVTGPNGLVVRIGGDGTEWGRFHEPFGNDTYLKGPEFRTRLPAGDYTVVVTSPDNRGKYVLAIGERESFPPAEIARTMATMPDVKGFFGKPRASAYTSPFVLGIGIATAAVVAGVVVLVVYLARR
jgi:hypothetical protein